MRRRPKPYLVLAPADQSAGAVREVLAGSQRRLLIPLYVALSAVGAVLALSSSPGAGLLVLSALVLGALVGATLSGRYRSRHGLVPLTEQEFDLAYGACAESVPPEVVERVARLQLAVRTADQAAVDDAVARLQRPTSGPGDAAPARA